MSVNSLSAQHSADGERVLLRAFLRIHHDDLEPCSCNGTNNAARVARAAASDPRRRSEGTAGAAADARPTAAAAGAADGGEGAAGAGSTAAGTACVAPGTCGPAERYGHVVEVLLRTDDWSLAACSSSCCGVGYDALHSQLCPAVAAVLLAARMEGGGAVLCEQDMGRLATAAQGEAPEGAAAASTAAAGQGNGIGAGGGAPAFSSGPLTVGRLLSAASRGMLVLGPNHVDPLLPLPASMLPGPGAPLGLQQELESPRCTPDFIAAQLIPCTRPEAASQGGAGPGPSSSSAPAVRPAAQPPVPPPHIPVLPGVEHGNMPGLRYAGQFPSAYARSVFAGWYRQNAPPAVASERYRETYRMLLPPAEDAQAAGPAAGPQGAPARRVSAASARPPLPAAWSFGAGGGGVSLDTATELAPRYISSRAAERGPVWEARMNFLTANALTDAICKLLLASSLPAYLRAAAARLLGSWRLRLGDTLAYGRRTGYGSAMDPALSDLLHRLTTAYILARDGWDAPHLAAAMGLTAPGPSALPAAAAAAGAPDQPPAAAGGAGSGGAAAAGPAHTHTHAGSALVNAASAGRTGRQGGGEPGPAGGSPPSRPDTLPSWLGFRPAHAAAARAMAPEPRGTGAGGQGDIYGEPPPSTGAAPPPMPFVPYAPPPLQGVVQMHVSGLQEVSERLHWLGHFGLDGPYVALAAASGEWSKAIKMLLRRGAK
ncbi:hypothetical protein GPECTOR_4g543 [Gonium pectorale]|uniref:Uncharacterized protein n=1 Tax=Gonium pectorale TaxID=33097 RepID=A0A150GXR8_GONPE|nr:hypothetical protein GPECTOR_4g543 [Gonium pectorale]|eukprot:KXZ54478.1 hypothetical protein GPECTOR_4g543 [Gonium pectorale]